jgi:hypothetical protein
MHTSLRSQPNYSQSAEKITTKLIGPLKDIMRQISAFKIFTRS